MGEPTWGSCPRDCLSGQSEPGELKHLSTRRRRNQHWAQALEITRVAASETVPAQTGLLVGPGLQEPRTVREKSREVPWNGAPETVTAR
jgi:hypothetical protein